MLILGVVLMVLGWTWGVVVLQSLGLILLVVGGLLFLAGTSGPFGGRWW